MKRKLALFIPSVVLLLFVTSNSSRVAAGQSATAQNPRTLRLDYYHTGNDKQEWFSLDRVVLEPLPWPGDLRKSIDESNLGNYRFEVRAKSSGKLLYSR